MSSSEIKNVIIIGAAGNLGPQILSVLLDSSFNVTVLSRESSSSTFPSGVKVVRANYDSIDSLKSAFQGQDAVLSSVGGTALGDQQKLIDGAIAAGVKRFIPSEYGSNTENPKVLATVPVFQAKVATVEYSKSKEDVISWSSVITGPFFDWGITQGFSGFDIKSKTANIVDGGNYPFTATNLRQIGRTVVKILENPSASKNQHVYTSSFTISQNEILALIEKISGDKYTVTETTSKKLVEEGNAKVAKHDYSGIVDLIRSVIFTSEGWGDYSSSGLWNEKSGLPKEDLEESIKAALNGKAYGEK